MFLSDRVIVMTPRPGRIDSVVEAVREHAAFAGYARAIRDRFMAQGVLRDIEEAPTS